MKASTHSRKLTSARRVKQEDGVARKWMSQIQLLRMRVAAAESLWKEVKEQVGQAKRRRKLAKLFAKRAKKNKKRAGANLEQARKALAEAETQLATISRRPAPRKVSKSKNARALSKKRPTRKRSVRKLPLAADQAASRDPSAALHAAAASPPATTNREASTVA